MADPKPASQVGGLSKRALEILQLLAEGLSDREIAERLVMTVNTVKWYNRQIYSILGVGSRTQAIAHIYELGELTVGNAVQPASSTYTAGRLPLPATRFIGRRREIETVKRFLERTRLLTLVGPPGTGKTRLAMQAAEEITESFRDGVFFISLGRISDPTLVINAVAEAVGIKEIHDQPLVTTIQNAVGARRMLLILDNFEHLQPAALSISALLAGTTNLSVLATSRQPLHLYGEQEFAVPPMALPNPDDTDLAAVETCESTALFVQRARAVRPDFELTADNALDIAKICVRLDGLPLAIELAAARTKLMTPRQLLARLGNRLDLLVGGAQDLHPRHRALNSTIAWSYDLLDEHEKILFQRLSVFQDGCSIEAAEAVCSAGLAGDVFGTLESLVNKSLVQCTEEADGMPRFRMLETLREYAGMRLDESGETATLEQRHAEYFLSLAERAEPELRLAEQGYWFNRLDADHENIRAALTWSLSGGDKTLGARLAGAFYLFWYARGHHAEGRQWTLKLLAALEDIDRSVHAKLLFAAGHMEYMVDMAAGQRYFEQALSAAQAEDDTAQIAWSLIFIGYTKLHDTPAALTMAQRGLALFRTLNHQAGIAQALNIIGEIAKFGGDDDRARQAYEACLKVTQETGEIRRTRYIYANLTMLAMRSRDYDRARTFAVQGLRLAIEMDNILDIADSAAVLSGVIGVMGDAEISARIFGAWDAILSRMGAKLQPADRPYHEQSIAAVRDRLSPAQFEYAWAEGQQLSVAEVIQLLSAYTG
jgi:non-specific serine/threonine protein kinase